jgi:hypothetical protein
MDIKNEGKNWLNTFIFAVIVAAGFAVGGWVAGKVIKG